MPSLLLVPAGVLALLASAGPLAGPPPNLRVDPALGPVVAEMWAASETFRAQCRRLAEAPDLLVAVWYDDEVMRGSRRAATTFVHHAGRLVSAQVRLGRGHDPVEQLAHELEHIVEQLDGVNLPIAAAIGGGATRARDGSFETQRAIEAGLRAQREVRRAGRVLAEAKRPAAPPAAPPAVRAYQSVPGSP